jgi:UDP-2,3-diacylglucosamine pyrophosphatase LpxH
MKEAKKRKVDLIVISDVHLGTLGCRAKALEAYLKSVQPRTLILNGDIVDMWQFSRRYWPKSHMKILRRILTFLSRKTEVIYIPGNHDELVRKFRDMKIGRLSIRNKAVLEFPNERVWIFHGDAFDVTMQHSRWLVKLGAIGYDLLILLNTGLNAIREKMGKGRISFSGRIKASVKKAVSYINSFEETVVQIAADQGFDTVICGHIHQPADKIFDTGGKKIRYLNSGDWIENLTALEYHQGVWTLYRHPETSHEGLQPDEDPIPDKTELFHMLRRELTAGTLQPK